jgi:hypothetical protein
MQCWLWSVGAAVRGRVVARLSNHRRKEKQMRFMTGITGVVIAVLALCIATSASALVLPDIHVLSGETYPLHLNFSDNKTTAFNSNDTAGDRLLGSGILLLLLTFELSSLGSFGLLFLKVITTHGASCNSEGDSSGEMLIKGSFHIVPLNTNKEDALLYLFKEFTIECGTELVKVRGSFLSRINFRGVAETGDFTELCTSLSGDFKGKNTITKYLEDAGNSVPAILEVNLKTVWLRAAWEFPELCPEALAGKMFQVLSR